MHMVRSFLAGRHRVSEAVHEIPSVQQSKNFIAIENFDIFHTLVTSQVVIYIHAIKHEALESTRSSIKFSAVSITYGKIGSVY